MIVRKLMVLETRLPDGHPHPEAKLNVRLDCFRETVQPSENYGLVFYSARPQDLRDLTQPGVPRVVARDEKYWS